MDPHATLACLAYSAPMLWVTLALVGVLAGAINAVAGGGTLFTFPTLLAFGMSPIAANATSTVALVPGSFSAFWGLRRVAVREPRELMWMALPSLAGGICGALLVLWVGNAMFARIVPWLIYGATLLFLAQARIKRWIDARIGLDAGGHRRRTLQVCTQLAIAVFGAGMGVLMLALLGMIGSTDLSRMNGQKNFAAVCINGVAAVTFALSGHVQWMQALCLAVGAIAGGYGAARVSQRVDVRYLRALVVLVGFGMGTYTLLRA
jgi:uncharacterized membrane protein YfcA